MEVGDQRLIKKVTLRMVQVNVGALLIVVGLGMTSRLTRATAKDWPSSRPWSTARRRRQAR